jgi:hypothetical protein
VSDGLIDGLTISQHRRIYRTTAAPEPTPAECERLGDHAEQVLIPLAEQLVIAVREDGRDCLRKRIALIDQSDIPGLIITLAAMVDPDKSRYELLSWIDFDEHGRRLPVDEIDGARNFARLERSLREAS